jgi:DNA-directed RNA polymerase subunit K/omega
MKGKKARQLQMGDQVAVMINRNNPKQAFIRDLYL